MLVNTLKSGAVACGARGFQERRFYLRRIFYGAITWLTLVIHKLRTKRVTTRQDIVAILLDLYGGKQRKLCGWFEECDHVKGVLVESRPIDMYYVGGSVTSSTRT